MSKTKDTPITKKRILEVAIDLFSKKGFLGVTPKEIAKGADVAKGAYWPTISVKGIYSKKMRVLPQRFKIKKAHRAKEDVIDANTLLSHIKKAGFRGKI